MNVIARPILASRSEFSTPAQEDLRLRAVAQIAARPPEPEALARESERPLQDSACGFRNGSKRNECPVVERARSRRSCRPSTAHVWRLAARRVQVAERRVVRAVDLRVSVDQVQRGMLRLLRAGCADVTRIESAPAASAAAEDAGAAYPYRFRAQRQPRRQAQPQSGEGTQPSAHRVRIRVPRGFEQRRPRPRRSGGGWRLRCSAGRAQRQ